MTFAVLALFAQSKAQAQNSASSSPNSDTDASRKVSSSEFRVPNIAHEPSRNVAPEDATRNSELRTRNLINACAAAVDDLAKTRLLAEVLEQENKLLNERLETEKYRVTLLSELNATRSSESEALRAAIAAKNETIAAKDIVIARQDKLADALKHKKTSPWKRIGDILLGAAVFAILK